MIAHNLPGSTGTGFDVFLLVLFFLNFNHTPSSKNSCHLLLHCLEMAFPFGVFFLIVMLLPVFPLRSKTGKPS